MDFPPIAAFCWLIPGICLIAALLNSERGAHYRKPLYGVLALFIFCSGLAGWGTYQDVKNQALLQAVQAGNLAQVEDCLRQGANPSYIPIDIGPNLIEIARSEGHEEIARRLERASKAR